MIEVKNLTKKYGSNVAVNDISFTVDKGQIYGFLGPNGAGKSTTMNIITGYLSSTAGTVTIDGFDILKDPLKAKKSIGYLPEIPPVYPDMTIREYLDFAGGLKGLPKKERAQEVIRVMEKTGITDMKDRLIKNLSKGYRQRAGLAQAILGDPEVIILDEPTVGLDPGQIIEIRELLRELKQDHTILLSSHILQEISAVCDHIMIISKGRLVASDTAENISGSIKGISGIRLIVKGSEEAAKKAAGKVEGTSELIIKKGTEEGTVRLEIRYPSEKDLREAVFNAFASSKVPILSMESRTESLEDIYLKLTGEEPETMDDPGTGEEPDTGDGSGADIETEEEKKQTADDPGLTERSEEDPAEEKKQTEEDEKTAGEEK